MPLDYERRLGGRVGERRTAPRARARTATNVPPPPQIARAPVDDRLAAALQRAVHGRAADARLARQTVVTPTPRPEVPFFPEAPPEPVEWVTDDIASEGAGEATADVVAEDLASSAAEAGIEAGAEEGAAELAVGEGVGIGLGAAAVGLLAGVAAFLWPNSTAPAWMDELNPITGGPYASEAEYHRVKGMSQAQIEAARAGDGVQAAPKAPELSNEEKTAVENKQAGRPYDVSAYKRAIQKINRGQKYEGDRNKQKRKDQ